MTFERYLEDNIFTLQEELSSGVYRHGTYEPFTIHDPKQRTIHKATVKDRVVHQAVVNIIESLFESKFIYDSYSCRVRKGTHAAVKRLRTFLWRASKNNTRTIYALKCDVQKFFASVNHKILKELLRKRIDSVGIMLLLESTIDSFHVAPDRGIPLGNLTSQLFANVYLHELDWFMKQKLCVKYYLRYCDDFILILDSPFECNEFIKLIDTFLDKTLKIRLHPNKVDIKTWKQGVDFLGYISLPYSTNLRPSTARRALRHAAMDNASSYLGLCQHADAHLIENIIRNKTSS